jgi:hypothetical protein
MVSRPDSCWLLQAPRGRFKSSTNTIALYLHIIVDRGTSHISLWCGKTIFAILVLCQPAQELEPRLESDERFQGVTSPPLEGDGADHQHWRRVSIAQFQRIYYSGREMSARGGISAQLPPQCWGMLSTERPPTRSPRAHFPLMT